MNSRNIYIEFAKNWYWLIALGAIISLGATYLAIKDSSVVYRSTSTLQIGRTIENESPDQAEIAITDRLVTVYGELATRDPVLDAVIETLQLNLTPDDLRARMLVNASPTTQLVDITVIESDPDVAAAIANEVARQLALTSPGPGTDSDTQRFLINQMEDLQGKIIEAQSEVEELEISMIGMTSAADIYDAQQRLEVLNAQVDTWQQTYSALLTQIEPTATNIVQIISEAKPASAPLPRRTTLYYGFAMVLGISLATLLALGLEHFDHAIRNAEDFLQLDEPYPVVDVPSFKMRKTSQLIALKEPDSLASSAYRVLRNNVKLHMARGESSALMVTSTQVGEGKTTTAANLGLSLANSGNFVIVVDANFHNPELDELFGAELGPGFSDLLLGLSPARDVIQETEHPYLWLVGSGKIPPNHLDVLASDQMTAAVNMLLAQADIVIFDSPALNQEQESQLLAKATRNVILIAESGRATPESLARASVMVSEVNAMIHVVVVNKVRRPWHSYLLQWPWSRQRRLEARARERRQRKSGELSRPLSADNISTSIAD